jgi:hypothetical protein
MRRQKAYGVDMNTDIRLRVQEALDELLMERLIPFALTAQKVNAEGPGKYVVPFYDSRIHSFRFSWTDCGLSFKEIIRTAVLERVKSMDSPPDHWLA